MPLWQAFTKEANVSDPKEQQQEPDELKLEPETVRDLDVDDTDAEGVVGGQSRPTTQPNAPD